MDYGNGELAPNSTSLCAKLTPQQKKNVTGIIILCFMAIVVAVVITYAYFLIAQSGRERRRQEQLIQNYVPDIIIPSMDFTVLNLTKTSLSVKWDLVIRLPSDLPGYYMCLKGDFQTFILYKGVTIANSSLSYNLIPHWAQLLNTSLVASEGDMDNVIMKDIMEDIKVKRDMRFGSLLLLPDCRSGRKMNYTCDEIALRFKPGSQRKATEFENASPICHYNHP